MSAYCVLLWAMRSVGEVQGLMMSKSAAWFLKSKVLPGGEGGGGIASESSPESYISKPVLTTGLKGNGPNLQPCMLAFCPLASS